MPSRIRQERIGFGLTQGELAAKLGVKPNTIGRWEKDASCVKQEHLIEMSRIFGCSISWLVGMSETRTQTA